MRAFTRGVKMTVFAEQKTDNFCRLVQYGEGIHAWGPHPEGRKCGNTYCRHCYTTTHEVVPSHFVCPSPPLQTHTCPRDSASRTCPPSPLPPFGSFGIADAHTAGREMVDVAPFFAGGANQQPQVSGAAPLGLVQRRAPRAGHQSLLRKPPQTRIPNF